MKYVFAILGLLTCAIASVAAYASDWKYAASSAILGVGLLLAGCFGQLDEINRKL